jgi:uncharacterized protein (TIGR02145 family)
VDGANWAPVTWEMEVFGGEVIGGRVYRTITLNNQTWMAENLEFTWDGLSLDPEGCPEGQAAWYVNRDKDTYGADTDYHGGLLYNGPAMDVLESKISGWHLPTKDDWEAIKSQSGWSMTTAQKMKCADGIVNSNWPSGYNGDDLVGFTAIPVGRYYAYGGYFDGFGTNAYFWLDDEESGYRRWVGMRSGSANIVFDNYEAKYYGFSVRLVKDGAQG